MTTDFKVGCQTFTWEMLGAGWSGTADDLLAAPPPAVTRASKSPIR